MCLSVQYPLYPRAVITAAPQRRVEATRFRMVRREMFCHSFCRHMCDIVPVVFVADGSSVDLCDHVCPRHVL